MLDKTLAAVMLHVSEAEIHTTARRDNGDLVVLNTRLQKFIFSPREQADAKAQFAPIEAAIQSVIADLEAVGIPMDAKLPAPRTPGAAKPIAKKAPIAQKSVPPKKP